MTLVGCSETAGAGGSGGSAGTGGMPECGTPEDCDDSNECTDNRCADGLCESTPVADGTACKDGSECSTGMCADGLCEFTPVADGTACEEGNECSTGMCADGLCESTPVADGTACEEGNECSTGMCGGGVCVPGADGTACGDDVGTCQQGGCQVPCTEQGILDAIAAGGGRFTFDCDGPTTVVTVAEIIIDNDVILDGEGRLTVTGFTVTGNAVVELRGMTLTGGITNRGYPTLVDIAITGGGIYNIGVMTATRVAVSGSDRGIDNVGRLTADDLEVSGNTIGVQNSGTIVGTGVTVSNNEVTAVDAPGIGVRNYDGGTMTLTNCTISGNTVSDPDNLLFQIAIWNVGVMTLTHCTVVGDGTDMRSISNWGPLTASNTLIDSGCKNGRTSISSTGYNIESPGDSCGFDQPTDQVNVSTADLKLGPLQDNGGPTETHALGEGSVAINLIPEAMCEVDEDQRGVERPQGPTCDVGAVEMEGAP